ncbi:RadC family protein [Klebsiella variicola]|uniref:RadC family protein n=1 Tax=Klebsiella variicola TaxID=244366 RepID=UPI0013CFEB41|nr:DNA repair protein RadC [Klebsiella variicola]
MNTTNSLSVVAELAPATQRAIKRALTLLESQLREPGVSFTSSSSVRDWLRLQMALLEREAFMLLWLDNQNRLIAHETLFKGTINSTEVHPREVVKSGLKHNAAAAVLAHNHPSGQAEPSHADQQITKRLKSALTLVDIRLLDHLVVGGMDVVSFAERGWL